MHCSNSSHRLRWYIRLLCLVSCVWVGSAGAAWSAGEGLDIWGNAARSPSVDNVGIRPMGMGNGGLALSDGPEGFTLNPAGLARFNGSFFEGGFYFHPSADYRVFNVSVADGKTNPLIAGGASYSYYIAPRDSDGKRRTIAGHIVRLGTAFRWQKQIFLGVSVKYLHLERPFYTDLSVPQLDVGITWQIFSLLSVSVVGYNLIYNDSRETPISLGFGAAFGYQFPLRITFDWVMDFQSRHRYLSSTDPNFDASGPLQIGHELRVGIEYEIAKMVSIRAGYLYDAVRDNGHHISFGLGFKYRWFGAQAAYKQQLASARQGENRTFAFTLRIFF